MSPFPGFRRMFRIHRPEDAAKMVDDELRFHFQMTIEALMAEGLDAAAARAEAERRFGDIDATREGLTALDRARTIGERRGEWWAGLVQDLRYALRGLRLRPGFAAAVTLTLGLGIGANATMFGIVDRLLLRPPAYLARPADVHLTYFARTFDGVERFQLHTSVPRLRDLQRWTRSFDEIAAYSSSPWAVGAGADAQELSVMSASANFWQLFDARPVLGRFFDAEDDSLPERSRVVVVGYGYWQSHLGGRRDVVGDELRLGRHVYTIIGVAPAGFAGLDLEVPAAFVPLTAGAYGEEFGGDTRAATSYGYGWLAVVVRRRPGVSIEAATADLSSAFVRSFEARRVEQPSLPAEVVRPHAVLGPVQRAGGPNWFEHGQSVAVAAGCGRCRPAHRLRNVGNLLLARTIGRRREIAVRLALGVSRARLLRQILVEASCSRCRSFRHPAGPVWWWHPGGHSSD
ncbi:MAG: ABC transporter permease [Gemmatimonadales bacterium]